MQRKASAYLGDVVEACDAITSVLAGVEFDEYHATRMLRSAVEREFTIIGEAVVVLSRTEPQLFARITNGRRIVDFRKQLTHAYLQVDDRIVWLIARDDVPVLRAECEALLAGVGDAD
ncbi:MAG TPA: HepT-like ribonuclease domain-containing protein [Thermoleophilia bacterium]